LCENFGFKPTWLNNYEMAKDLVFINFAKDFLARKQGEVGMHLHAWNSQPLYDLTDDDKRYKPYLIEYQQDIIRLKVEFMTQLLEETFQTKMLSHRAGRWAFNEYYAELLIELGYHVDCSVTPRVDWYQSLGAPQGKVGTNYRNFLPQAYFLDPQDISRAGNSTLLEVPMSIEYKYPPSVSVLKRVMNGLRGEKRDHRLTGCGLRVGTSAK
jgi:hypothetical protein